MGEWELDLRSVPSLLTTPVGVGCGPLLGLFSPWAEIQATYIPMLKPHSSDKRSHLF